MPVRIHIKPNLLRHLPQFISLLTQYTQVTLIFSSICFRRVFFPNPNMPAETLSQQPNGAVANGDLNPLSNTANGTAAKKSRESERRRRRRKQKKNRKASQAPEATASDLSDGDDVKENNDPQQVLYPCLLSRNCLVSY